MCEKAPDRIYIDEYVATCLEEKWDDGIEYALLPPGHVIVPVEPTPTMKYIGIAAGEWDEHFMKSEHIMPIVERVYKAMIAAAQKPEKS